MGYIRKGDEFKKCDILETLKSGGHTNSCVETKYHQNIPTKGLSL